LPSQSGREVTLPSESDSDLVSVFTIEEDTFKISYSRKSKRLQKGEMEPGSSSKPTVPWAHNLWENISVNKYKGIDKEGLYVLLQCLKHDYIHGGYIFMGFNEQVSMITKSPIDLYELLFEVITSLGGKNLMVKSEMNDILTRIQKFIDMTPEEVKKCREKVDLNFRKFEMTDFQYRFNFSDEHMEKLKRHFFN